MTAHPLPIPDKKVKFNKLTFIKVAPRIYSLIKPYFKHVALGMSALILASIINLSIPYLIRNWLNSDFAKLISNNYLEIGLTVITLFICQGLLFYLRHYHLQIIGLKIATHLKQEMLGKLLEHKITFFDESNTGDLLSRLNLDTDLLQKGISVNISVVLRYSIQAIVGVGLMFFISPLLTFIIVGTIPLIAIFSISFSKNLKQTSKETQNALSQSIVSAEEAIHAIRVVKLFSNEIFEQKKYNEISSNALALGDKRIHLAALFSSSMVTILHIAMALVFIIGSYFVAQNDMLVGDLTAFLLYGVIVAISFGFLLNAWAEFVQSLAAAERIYSIIDGNHENLHLKEDVLEEKPAKIKKFDLLIEELSFSYPSRPQIKVINSISCAFPENKTTAIVGPSGSGKSTLVSLLPRLYDTFEGRILIGGSHIKDIDLRELRKSISFVPQNPQLFSSTIRDNILYGKPDATEEELHKAIHEAALEELILKLPHGINTQIGDKGIQLSGGEKQRISIARALIKNPKILILDEATSSLDSHNEYLIQSALEKAQSNRTVIVIAHRLSTVKNADQVIVLNKGTISQIGTHQDLSETAGIYKDLVQYQLSH